MGQCVKDNSAHRRRLHTHRHTCTQDSNALRVYLDLGGSGFRAGGEFGGRGGLRHPRQRRGGVVCGGGIVGCGGGVVVCGGVWWGVEVV